MLSVPLFLVLFTWVLLSIALGLKFYEWWRKREMSAMLRTAAADPTPGGAQLLRNLSAKRPVLEVWLERLSLLEKTQSLLQQAGVEWTPGGLLLAMAGGAAGAVILNLAIPSLFYLPGTAVAIATLFAGTP